MATSGEFLYQPDVIVDVDLPPLGAVSARNPQVVFEVAAAGSERASFIEQWQIYRSLPTLKVYALVDASQMAVTLHRRAGETWKMETFEDPDDQLFLPTIQLPAVAGKDLRRGFSRRRGGELDSKRLLYCKSG